MRRPDIPVLTSLRFPAALAIVLFHYLLEVGWSPRICEGLASGVSFFYVLSGFILYYNYVDLKDRGAFWMARFARIWPVHIVTLVLVWAVLPFDFLLGHAHWQMTLPANIVLVQAWLPFQGSAFSYNGVAWSLSVEAFFYLCFPWLLMDMKKRGAWPIYLGALLLGFVLVLLVSILWPAGSALGSFSPIARLSEFVLGMGTCQLWFAQSRQTGRVAGWSQLEWATLAGVLALTLLGKPLLYAAGILSPVADWFVTAISAFGFAWLIWVYAHQAGLVSSVIASRFFVLLGEVSFSVYMCHQIILRWMGQEAFFKSWDMAAFFSFYIGTTLGLSFLLFFLVEMPMRHLILRLYRGRKKATA